jgi:hypothetical protein
LRRPRVPASKGKPRHGVAARGGASGPVAILQEGNFGATEATLAGGDVFRIETVSLNAVLA